MCQSTNARYACGHLGGRSISHRCTWAIKNNVRSGCFDTSSPEGIKDLDYLCPGCQSQEKSGSASSFTHVGMDEIRRPLTKNTIAEGRLKGTLEQQEEKGAEELARKHAAVKNREDEREKETKRITRERRASQGVHERRKELKMEEEEMDAIFEMQMEASMKRHEERRRLLREEYSGFEDEIETNLGD